MFSVVLRCPRTGEERELPGFLEGKVEVGALVTIEGRQWLVAEAFGDSVT